MRHARGAAVCGRRERLLPRHECDVPEALADPQILAREMIQAVEHITAGMLRVVGVPIKLLDTPGSVRAAPPTLGQHTEAILRELQIGDDEIGRLRDARVIG